VIILANNSDFKSIENSPSFHQTVQDTWCTSSSVHYAWTYRNCEDSKYYETLLQEWTGLRRPAKTEYVWVSKAWFISVYCGIAGFESISVKHSQTNTHTDTRLSNSVNFCEDW